MISLTKDSKLAPPRVIEKAVAFFGPGGWGLEVIDRAECCARFEGGGGHVFVQASEGKKGKGSEVAVDSREWERAAKEFLTKVESASISLMLLYNLWTAMADSVHHKEEMSRCYKNAPIPMVSAPATTSVLAFWFLPAQT